MRSTFTSEYAMFAPTTGTGSSSGLQRPGAINEPSDQVQVGMKRCSDETHEDAIGLSRFSSLNKLLRVAA